MIKGVRNRVDVVSNILKLQSKHWKSSCLRNQKKMEYTVGLLRKPKRTLALLAVIAV